MQSGTISYVRNTEINRKAWNACIDTATNGLIYAYSFYLDTMCPNWDALVLNNYEAVMPLPWRRKWGVHYLYQPFAVAQLGLFGKSVTATLLQDFLKSIPSFFRYWDFMLNHGNVVLTTSFPVYERRNYILSLQPSYDKIYSGYRDNIKRNIKKSIQYNCTIKKDIAVKDVIELAKQQTINSHIPANNFTAFETLYHLLYRQQKALTYGVYASGELVASCVLFFSHHRIYYILVGNHPNGRTLGASHALIDAFIKDYSGSNWILDFEGSDVRNLAFFYSSFGATEEVYAAIKWNRLPWYARWLKE